MIKVALIGAGYWGSKLLRVLLENPRIVVVEVVDRDPAKLAVINDRYPNVPTAATVWFGEDKDAVVIAAPLAHHTPLTHQALIAGKHVLVEKPMTDSVEDAEILVDLARSGGLTLMVGHTFLYDQSILDVRDVRSWPGYDRIVMERLNTVGRDDVPVLWDLGAHDLSILYHWTHETPRSVTGTITHGTVHLDLEYHLNNMHVTLDLSYHAQERRRRITLLGHDVRVVEDVIAREPLAREVDAFLDSIETGRSPLADGNFGLEIVRQLTWIEETVGGTKASRVDTEWFTAPNTLYSSPPMP